MRIGVQKDSGIYISYLALRPVVDESGHPGRWEGKIGNFSLSIHLNSDGSISHIEKSQNVNVDNEDVISQFLEQREILFETESAGIESGDEVEPSPGAGAHPYDPDLIRVDTKPFSVKQTYELIVDGDIDLSPDFQRHFVWKEIEKRSRLIESIMLRIPLPVFYLSQDKEGRFQVVDGLQRLTVIKQFLNNEFRLRNLEYLKDCESKLFDKKGSSLDPKYIRRISQTQLVMNIIDPQTPSRVKFEIFKRINQGGKPLRPQEIRNCMAMPHSRAFISSLAQSNEFKVATDFSISPIRMEDQELILRFIGFYYTEKLKRNDLRYTGSMEPFLDDTLDVVNAEKPNIITLLSQKFINSMKNAYFLFGKFAFRKCIPEHLKPNARKQLINKSMFTAWSVLLADLDHSKVISKSKEGILINPVCDEIGKYESYYDSITFGTNDLSRIKTSFKIASDIINNNVRL